MGGQVPQTPFDIRRQIAVEGGRELGYRAVQILAYIKTHMEQHGRPPSYSEIRDELGFSDKADVCKCVARLEQRALIVKAKPGKSGRGIRGGAILRLP